MSQCKTADVVVDDRPAPDPGDPTVRIASETTRGIVAAPPMPAPGSRHHQQLSHDIRHELGTVMMLASLLADGEDVGPEGRRWAAQLLAEAEWLAELQKAQESTAEAGTPGYARPEPVRLDLCARQTVAALAPSSATVIDVGTTSEVWAVVDKLAFWRALRNVVGNAIRAAGPTGRVVLTVQRSGPWAVAQVDDTGPGFGGACSGTAAMGLDIVYESVAACAGRLEIRRGDLGGCCVRLGMPAAHGPVGSFLSTSTSDAFRGFDAIADL